MNVPNIENAYENIKMACDEKLKNLFPAGIPEIAKQRYEHALKHLERINPSFFLDHYEIYRLLCIEAKKSLQYLCPWIADISNFVLYLLNDSLINPFPPHYYCTECGYFELVDTHLFGMDLPHKKCPYCKNALRKDGFNLYVETACNIQNNCVASMLLRTTPEFLPFAKRVLENQFPSNDIIPLGTLTRETGKERLCMVHTGFIILDTGKHIDDFPHLQGYLEDGTPCIADEHGTEEFFRVYLIPSKTISHLTALQSKTGIYLHDITLKQLEQFSWIDLKKTYEMSELEAELMQEIQPKTFSELASISAISSNSYTGIETSDTRGYIKLIDEFDLLKSPFRTREDIFNYLLNAGIDYEDAFRLSEAIRKGRFSHHRKNTNAQLLNRYAEILKKTSETFQRMLPMCNYITTRGQAVQMVLFYAMLAYYLKNDIRSYKQVVYQDKSPTYELY